VVAIVGFAVYAFVILDFGNGDSSDPEGEMYVVPQLSVRDMNFYALGDDPILTNLARDPETNRGGVLRTSVLVGINNTIPPRELSDFMSVFNGRIGVARSTAQEVIFAATYESIRTPEGKAALAEMIRLALLDMFETDLIVSIRFEDWLIQ
jgi:flagellar basal body-associated protein FliL